MPRRSRLSCQKNEPGNPATDFPHVRHKTHLLPGPVPVPEAHGRERSGPDVPRGRSPCQSDNAARLRDDTAPPARDGRRLKHGALPVRLSWSWPSPIQQSRPMRCNLAIFRPPPEGSENTHGQNPAPVSIACSDRGCRSDIPTPECGPSAVVCMPEGDGIALTTSWRSLSVGAYEKSAPGQSLPFARAWSCGPADYGAPGGVPTS